MKFIKFWIFLIVGIFIGFIVLLATEIEEAGGIKEFMTEVGKNVKDIAYDISEYKPNAQPANENED